MINFTKDRNSLCHHLTGFYAMVEHERGKNPDISIGHIANHYLDNEISMEKGMADYYNYLRECDRKNERLLRAIGTVKGKTFLKHLRAKIKNSEADRHGGFEIVRTPTGKRQTESEYGRAIREEWVDQYVNGGMTGDHYEGTICIKIKETKYLKFHYSM